MLRHCVIVRNPLQRSLLLCSVRATLGKRLRGDEQLPKLMVVEPAGQGLVCIVSGNTSEPTS